jgi:hypothetical protein
MTTFAPPAVLSRDLCCLDRNIGKVVEAQQMLADAHLTSKCLLRHCDYFGFDFLHELKTEINKVRKPYKKEIPVMDQHIHDSTKAIFLYNVNGDAVGRMVLNANFTGPRDSRVYELHTDLECVSKEDKFKLTKILHTCAEAFVVDYAKMSGNADYSFYYNTTRQHVTMVSKCKRYDFRRAGFLESIGYTIPVLFRGDETDYLDRDFSFRKDVYVTHPFSGLAAADEA